MGQTNWMVAVLKRWWAYMSCAAFTILGVIGVIFHMSGTWLVRSTFYLAGVFLFLALALELRHVRLELSKERSKKPKFQIQVDRVIRSTFNDPRTLFVHVVIVNEPETASSVRRVLLIDQKGDEFEAIPFKTAPLYTDIQSVVAAGTEIGFSIKGSQIFETLPDILETIKSVRMVGYKHEEGWLLFQVKDRQESTPDSYTLSIRMDDAKGDPHDSGLVTCRAENRKVALK